jgi:hypothetical protein
MSEYVTDGKELIASLDDTAEQTVWVVLDDIGHLSEVIGVFSTEAEAVHATRNYSSCSINEVIIGKSYMKLDEYETPGYYPFSEGATQ